MISLIWKGQQVRFWEIRAEYTEEAHAVPLPRDTQSTEHYLEHKRDVEEKE